MERASEKPTSAENSEDSSSYFTHFDVAQEEPWDTFLMTSLPERITGLPMVIYVSLKQGGHVPRLKVSKQYGDEWTEGQSLLVYEPTFPIRCHYRLVQ